MIIAFWASVALLLGGALLFVLPPLLRPAGPVRAGLSPLAAYRDQRAQIDAEFAQGALTKEQHALALEELQARVIDEVGDTSTDQPLRQERQPLRMIVALALAIPAGALALYAFLGSPAALQPDEQQAVAGKEGAHAMSQEQIEAMVEQLAEKLK
jgi:cytochrome c-type biogenesis protein CcmH